MQNNECFCNLGELILRHVQNGRACNVGCYRIFCLCHEFSKFTLPTFSSLVKLIFEDRMRKRYVIFRFWQKISFIGECILDGGPPPGHGDCQPLWFALTQAAWQGKEGDGYYHSFDQLTIGRGMTRRRGWDGTITIPLKAFPPLYHYYLSALIICIAHQNDEHARTLKIGYFQRI